MLKNKIKYISLDLIRNINDPEHPLTLEQLNVVELSLIEVSIIIFHNFIKFTILIKYFFNIVG